MKNDLEILLERFRKVAEIQVGRTKVAIVAVFMPHAKYPDETVEKLYDEISREVTRARKQKQVVIIAGDWNAEVGCHDPSGTVRGRWLTPCVPRSFVFDAPKVGRGATGRVRGLVIGLCG